MRYIPALGLAILLSSCTTTTNYYDQTVDSWKGARADGLVKTWGKPDNVVRGPYGHIYYVYKTRSYVAAPTSVNSPVGMNVDRNGKPVMTMAPNTNTTWNRGSMTLTCTTLFMTDTKGVILETKTQGNGCYGSVNFARRLANPRAPVVVSESNGPTTSL